MYGIEEIMQVLPHRYPFLLVDRITVVEEAFWSPRENRVRSSRRERLGALTLSERPWDAPPEAMARAMLEGVRSLGLRLTDAAERFRARVALARGVEPELAVA